MQINIHICIEVNTVHRRLRRLRLLGGRSIYGFTATAHRRPRKRDRKGQSQNLILRIITKISTNQCENGAWDIIANPMLLDVRIDYVSFIYTIYTCILVCFFYK